MSFHKKVASLLLSGVLFSGYAFAQNVNASLGGTVADSTGAVLANASVVAVGIDTGVETKTVTNSSGVYQFQSLQSGNYRVMAQMSGFRDFVYDPVILRVGAQVRLDFSLSVSGGATTVEVVATAVSPLTSSSAVVGGIVTGQQILQLPTIDRGATNLALTMPGFAGGIGGGVSVAGGATLALLTTVNGISVTNTRLDRAGGLQSFQLTQSVDLVEEVKVVTSPADAESGRSLGQVQMIVRSGTNQIHGSLVDGIRNTALNANTYFNNLQGLPRQDLKRHQFAARIGGPVIKNKTFFFGLYDGNRQVTSAATNRLVLTAPARQGNFRFFPGAISGNANATANPSVDLRGNPIQPASATGPLQTVSLFGRDPNRPNADPTGLVQSLIAATPLPNNYFIGDGLNTAGFTWQVPSFSNRDQFTGKIDHNFNDSHKMNFVFTRETSAYTSTTPNFPTAQNVGVSKVTSLFSSLNFTSTLSPTVLNDFKIGLQHPDIDQVGGTRAYPQAYPSNRGTLFTPGVTSFTSPIPGNIDARLVDPVYTIGDSLSWTKGRHSFKAGFQFDAMASNSFNINNNFVPSVALGAGNIPVQGVVNIPGLVAQNQALGQNLLTDLTGSVAQVTQGFGVADGKNPAWIPYPNRRAWHQRDMQGFFKDDFKVTSDLTMNLGIRWDWAGVPFDKWGRTPAPVGGFGGLFGISGNTFANAMWSPGAAAGSLMQIQTVGPNSSNPNQQLYKDYYKGFSPAIGLSWSIPYFGKDKTVLRAGYSWSRPMSQSFLAIDGSVSSFGTQPTVQPVTATFLSNVSLPLTPAFSNPLQIWPINDKTQNFNNYDPNFMPALVQNLNFSLERQLTSSMTVAVRYVGNQSTHLPGGYNLNFPNVYENGIADAVNITARGGNAPLFDRLLMGVNVPGAGTVNGTTLTGSQAMRSFNGTFNFLAGNNAGAMATYLNTTQALQPTATAVRGGILANAGLPANFVSVNPQYNNVNFLCACLNANYHSGVLELQKQASHGLAFQTNFVWAKGMQLNGTGRDPRNWDLQRTPNGQKFTYKFSGTYELPFGKNKPFLSATSGVSGFLGHIVGGWQTGSIITINTGSYLTIGCGGSPNGGTSACTTGMALPKDPGRVIKTGNGVVFYDPAELTQVADPYCASLTTAQNLQSRCTFRAMAYNGNILFQNSQQGVMGDMSTVTNWRGPSLISFDMNILRQFRYKERITTEFRLDAIAMTNTPHFNNPNLNINAQNFGRIDAPAAGNANSFTTPDPFNGNRVFVANIRVSF